MFEQFIFHLLAAALLLAAVAVTVVRNPVHASLCLVLCFFFMAGIWLLLLAEFLAVLLVLVYVGAVMVLFLFVVMLLDVNISALRAGFMRGLPLGVSVAVLMAIAMSWLWSPGEMDLLLPLLPTPGADAVVQGQAHDPVQAAGGADGNTAALGRVLFTEYLYAFEIAGALLLLAIVAAITLTLNPDARRRKLLDTESQLRASKQKRLRIVSLPRGDARQDFEATVDPEATIAPELVSPPGSDADASAAGADDGERQP